MDACVTIKVQFTLVKSTFTPSGTKENRALMCPIMIHCLKFTVTREYFRVESSKAEDEGESETHPVGPASSLQS